MLYETAARSAELLALDIKDLDLPNRRPRIRRKGGAVDVIVWHTGTARSCPSARGPDIRSGVRHRAESPRPAVHGQPPPSGRARLSYQQAAALFSQASGGATLHQLRTAPSPTTPRPAPEHPC
jgi:integrase